MLSDIRPVHTLNARNDISLKLIRDLWDLKPLAMLREIQALRCEVEKVLASKTISYEKLRSALVPSQKRREVALVFDSTAVNDTFYGLPIFERYMPLFNAKSDHSVLVGDYATGKNSQEAVLARAFCDAVTPVRNIRYRHSTQFFFVYINNLTEAMIAHFDAGLRPFAAYVGFADTTNGSAFKWLLSTMLANAFIKHGRLIIQGHEDDRPNEEDVNLVSLPFEKYGYTCRSLQSYLQGPLLTYKIERPVLDHDDTDTAMSLNAVTAKPLPLGDFLVEVDEAKATYIRSHNASAMARAGLEHVSSNELRRLIASKVRESYIYRLEYNAAADITKFNVIIEVPSREGDRPVRLLAALQYRPSNRTLRLITLF
jgi:hypothetical protein